jgi:hypothetical protein
VDSLPDGVREVVQRISAIPSLAPDDVKRYLADQISLALGPTQEQIKNVLHFNRGAGRFDPSTIEVLRTGATSSDAFGTFGSYVIGELMGDPAAARQFSSGINVASIALQIGLLVGTGGLGTLAGAATMLSSLSALQGVFGGDKASQDAVNARMLQEIRAEIKDLRREMDARFNRVENLQLQALHQLDRIIIDLEKHHLEASRQFSQLETNLARVDSYVRASDHQAKVEAFARNRGELLTRAEDPGAADAQEVIDRLQFFLDYANLGSCHPVFVHEPTGTLASNVARVGRIDLAVGLLDAAGDVLEIGEIRNLEQNPVEWARGVQAFIEAQALFPHVRNGTLKKMAQDTLRVGGVINHDMMQICSFEVLQKAAHGFLQSRTGLLNALRADIRKVIPQPGWHPVLGRMPKASLSAPFSPFEMPSRDLPIFILEDNGPFETWRMVETDERLYRAFEIGRILETVQSKEPKLWHPFRKDGVDYGGARSPSETLSLRGKKGQIGTLVKFGIPVYGPPVVTPTLKGIVTTRQPTAAIDVYKVHENKVEEFLAIVTDQLDDTGEVTEWISGLGSLNDNAQAKAYFDSAAALCLLFAIQQWRLSGIPDDPWQGALAAELPRSPEDIKRRLGPIVTGVTAEELPLLRPVGSDPAELSQFNMIKTALRDVPKGDRVSWADLSVYPEFIHLAPRIVFNWIESAFTIADQLSRRRPAGVDGLRVVENVSSRLSASLSYF